MQFRTQFPSFKFPFTLDHNAKIMTIGSCFADNIADKFSYFKFDILKNPFGITYNPISISNLLLRAVHLDYFEKKDIIFDNEQFKSYELHSVNNSEEEVDFLQNINQKIKTTKDYLKNADVLFITLGTSYVYETLESIVVNNCHKMPAVLFNKRMITIQESINAMESCIQSIQLYNPNIKIVFSVSPVRHQKDGFVQNQRSKSRIIEAVHALQQESVFYFPAYEIIMDDLRDYRFYGDDLLHPNNAAIEYIWNYLTESLLTENSKNTNILIDQILKSCAHRPFNTKSNSYLELKNQILVKINTLKTMNTKLNFDDQIDMLK
jgi:GSCFA family